MMLHTRSNTRLLVLTLLILGLLVLGRLFSPGSWTATAPVAEAHAPEPGTASHVAQEALAERCRGPEFRQFDFWLGRWEVRNPDGDVVGHNEIRRVAGGCGLLESWRGAGGGKGTSLNTYDPDLGRWTQRWVGAGATLWLEGGLEGEAGGAPMVLSGTRPRTTPQGEVVDRLTWTELDDGRVRQVWEVSADGGASWRAIFQGLYTRVSDSAMPESVPAG